MKPPTFLSMTVRHDGVKRTVREWIAITGVSKIRAWRRYMKMKWTLEDAVTTPPRKPGSARMVANTRLVECNGKVQSLSAWGRELGISFVCIAKRLRRYPVEIALTAPKCDGKFVHVDGTPMKPIEKETKIPREELVEGVSSRLACQRIRTGWTREQATKTPVIKHGTGSRWGHARGNINRIRDIAALGIAI